MRLTIRGAEDFGRLARDLKQAGRQDLRKELFRALNSSTKPARRAALDGLEDYLPDNYAAELRPGLSISATGRRGKNPSVRIRAKGRRRNRLIGPLNRGRLRHPLFGHSPWFDQQVKPGWWNDPMQRQADDVRRALVAAMREVASKIAD